MGVNDFINLSSPLRNLSRACACFRNTPKIVSGELLLSSSVTNGCVSRSCPVRILYSFDAASNIAVKLAVEGSVVCWLADIWESPTAVGSERDGQREVSSQSKCTALRTNSCRAILPISNNLITDKRSRA